MGVTVLDVSNPYDPQTLNRHPTDGEITDIIIDWPLIYAAAGPDGVTVITYDIPGNSFTQITNIPAPAGEEVTYLAMKTAGTTGAWDYLYAAARTAGVMIIDISDETNIFQVGTIPFSGTASLGSYHVHYLEDWDQLAIAQYEDGVIAYDLTSPVSPTFAFTIAPGLNKSNRVGSDDSGNLWVSDVNGQIDAWDISSGSPLLQGAHNWGWNTYREVIPFETNALVAGGYGGMQILNWSDPNSVYEETWVKSAGFNMHNTPGTDFFVMSNLNELAIFNTPAELVIIGTYYLSGCETTHSHHRVPRDAEEPGGCDVVPTALQCDVERLSGRDSAALTDLEVHIGTPVVEPVRLTGLQILAASL
ncbi:hypothetical protein ACFL44_03740 [Gemmatimonadota bacterium]